MLNFQLDGIIPNAITLPISFSVEYIIGGVDGLPLDLDTAWVDVHDLLLGHRLRSLGLIPKHLLKALFLSFLFEFFFLHFHVDLLELEVLDGRLLLG